MGCLDIVLDLKTRMVPLDEQTLPILDIKSLQDQSERYWMVASCIHSTSMFHIEPTGTQELTDRSVNNLDADYKAADLGRVVKDNCKHLSNADKSKFLGLLTEFKQTFDGTCFCIGNGPAIYG